MLADAIKKRKEGILKVVSFKTIIDSYLRYSRTEWQPFTAKIERNKTIGFHPSGLNSESCPRQLAFGLLHEKKMLNEHSTGDVGERYRDPLLEMTFDTGHLLHMLIQYSYLPAIFGDEYGTKVRVEVPVKSLHEKYLTSGTADIIIELQDEKRYVGDIKTMRTEKFASLNSIDDVSEQYMIQLNLYMYGLKIPRGFFFFINKNTGETKEFFVEFNPQWVRGALRQAGLGAAFLRKKRAPEILDECQKKQGQYKRCQFTSLCFQCKSLKDLSGITVKGETI